MTTKVVHYRRFDPQAEDWAKGSLQHLLKTSLETRTSKGKTYLGDWEARRIKVPGPENLIRFIHEVSISEEWIFGLLCLLLPDDWAAVVRTYNDQAEGEHKSLDEVMRQLEIAERPPNEGEDFLRGIAYWLVVGDHFFVVQHTSVSTRAFEEYFYSLFVASGVITEGDRFGLRAEFNKDAVGGDLENISAVEIGGVVSRPSPPPVPAVAANAEVPAGGAAQRKVSTETIQEQKTLGRQLSRFEKAQDVLKAVFGAPNAQQILDSIPAEAELEVDVRFGYKTTRRDISRETLKQIARAARNLPDGEVTAIGRGGGKQVGDDLRLSATMPFKLVRPNGSLLDLEDARTKMLRVYERFVEDNKIEL